MPNDFENIREIIINGEKEFLYHVVSFKICSNVGVRNIEFIAVDIEDKNQKYGEMVKYTFTGGHGGFPTKIFSFGDDFIVGCGLPKSLLIDNTDKNKNQLLIFYIKVIDQNGSIYYIYYIYDYFNYQEKMNMINSLSS